MGEDFPAWPCFAYHWYAATSGVSHGCCECIAARPCVTAAAWPLPPGRTPLRAELAWYRERLCGVLQAEPAEGTGTLPCPGSSPGMCRGPPRSLVIPVVQQATSAPARADRPGLESTGPAQMGSLPLPAHGPMQLQDAPVTPEPSGQCVSASPTSAGGREGRVCPAAFWLRAPALGQSPHRSGTQLSSSRRVTREPAPTPPFCNRGQCSPVVPVRNGARASQVPPGCFRAAGAGVGWALLPPPSAAHGVGTALGTPELKQVCRLRPVPWG